MKHFIVDGHRFRGEYAVIAAMSVELLDATDQDYKIFPLGNGRPAVQGKAAFVRVPELKSLGYRFDADLKIWFYKGARFQFVPERGVA